MSGITPLLDTLLHQVLGRSVDLPQVRDLNLPVSAPVSAQSARAVEDDSRLEPHAQVLSPAIQLASTRLSGGVTGAAQGQSPALLRNNPAASDVSLSPAARVIAAVLARYPQSSMAIAPSRPLLNAQPQSEVQVGEVASRLKESIQHSGLFFESHLGQWFRGGRSLQSLQLEPQMQDFKGGAVGERGLDWLSLNAEAPEQGVSARPAVGRHAAQFDMRADRSLQGGTLPAMPVAESEQQASGQEWGGAASVDRPAMRSDVLKDRISPDAASQGADAAESVKQSPGVSLIDAHGALVRHQLELLAIPQLRWEGVIWPGVFLALAVDVPPNPAEADAHPDGGDGRDASESEWKVDLAVRLDGLGELGAAIRLRGDQLALTLRSEQPALRGYFRENGGLLQDRLQHCGFSSVVLRLAPLDDSGGGHE